MMSNSIKKLISSITTLNADIKKKKKKKKIQRKFSVKMMNTMKLDKAIEKLKTDLQKQGKVYDCK